MLRLVTRAWTSRSSHAPCPKDPFLVQLCAVVWSPEAARPCRRGQECCFYKGHEKKVDGYIPNCHEPHENLNFSKKCPVSTQPLCSSSLCVSQAPLGLLFKHSFQVSSRREAVSALWVLLGVTEFIECSVCYSEPCALVNCTGGSAVGGLGHIHRLPLVLSWLLEEPRGFSRPL